MTVLKMLYVLMAQAKDGSCEGRWLPYCSTQTPSCVTELELGSKALRARVQGKNPQQLWGPRTSGGGDQEECALGNFRGHEPSPLAKIFPPPHGQGVNGAGKAAI